jgi:hypothetical protein
MKNSKSLISYAVILSINLLFAVKYFSRYSVYGTLAAIVVITAQILAVTLLSNKKLPVSSVRYSLYSLLIILVIFTVLCHRFISPESLNVDRWSIISSFFKELLKGNYPYYARSHLGNLPGLMPFYFIIAFPFYLIGDLNILSTTGYLLMIILILRRKHNLAVYGILSLIILTSVFLYWEIAGRSNMFTYSLLILLVLNFYEQTDKNVTNKSFFLSSVLSGLILSTRSIYILTYLVTFFSSLRLKEIKLKSLVIYLSVAVAAFLLTFMPLVIFFKEDFFIDNPLYPFIVKSSYLIPRAYVALMILISIFFSYLVKKGTDRNFYNGISLFAAILIYFLYHIIRVGFTEAFFGSAADISFFIFCIPFLMYSIIEEAEAGSSFAECEA